MKTVLGAGLCVGRDRPRVIVRFHNDQAGAYDHQERPKMTRPARADHPTMGRCRLPSRALPRGARQCHCSHLLAAKGADADLRRIAWVEGMLERANKNATSLATR